MKRITDKYWSLLSLKLLSHNSTPAFVTDMQVTSWRFLLMAGDRNLEISTHFLFEYWAFTKHCHSIVCSLFDNKVFTFLVTLISDSISSNFSLISNNSSTKSVFTEPMFLFKLATGVIKFRLTWTYRVWRLHSEYWMKVERGINKYCSKEVLYLRK